MAAAGFILLKREVMHPDVQSYFFYEGLPVPPLVSSDASFSVIYWTFILREILFLEIYLEFV